MTVETTGLIQGIELLLIDKETQQRRFFIFGVLSNSNGPDDYQMCWRGFGIVAFSLPELWIT
jgi:hypothetical protein